MELKSSCARMMKKLLWNWWFIALLLILLGPLSVVPQSAPPNPLGMGIALMQDGDYSAAITALTPIAQNTNSLYQSGRAHFLLGFSHHNLKQYDDARLHYQQVASAQPLLKHYAVYYTGRTYKDTGQLSQAADIFEGLAGLNPIGTLKARALMQLTRCHRALGNAQSTLDSLDELSRSNGIKDSWFTERIYLRGWALLRLGRISESATQFKKLYIEYPTTGYATKAGKMLYSEAAFSGRGDPLSMEDKLDRIEKLMDKNHATKALKELDPLIKAAELNNDTRLIPRLYKQRAMALYKARKSTDAIAAFKRAKAAIPGKDLSCDYYLAQSLVRLDRDEEALDIFKDIYLNHSNDYWAPLALERTAKLSRVLGKHDQALAAYQKLARDYPRHEKTAENMFAMGWVHYLKGEYQTALDYFTKVPDLKGEPTLNARKLYWTARTYERLGDPAKAWPLDHRILKDYWKTGYAFLLTHYIGKPDIVSNSPRKSLPQASPKPPWPQLILARELVAIGMREDAVQELKMAEKDIGSDRYYALEISRLHLAMGDYFRSEMLIYKNFIRDISALPNSDPELYRLTYPLAYAEWVKPYALKYRLDPFMVLSLMRAESTYRAGIRSPAGAVGLMQIMPATGKGIARELGEPNYYTDRLEDPELNIRFGTYYMRQMLDRAPSSGPDNSIDKWIDTFCSYNAGDFNLRKWRKRHPGARPDEFIEQIPFSETRNYVIRIMGFYHVYERVYPAGVVTP